MTFSGVMERTVPTRNISLTREQDEFVESIVRAGEYQNASEAVRDALRALQQRRREDALKLERLRVQIQAGIDDLENGDFIEIEDADLDAYITGIGGRGKNGPR
jgi:antitoxin ParD1/3/4